MKTYTIIEAVKLAMAGEIIRHKNDAPGCGCLIWCPEKKCLVYKSGKSPAFFKMETELFEDKNWVTEQVGRDIKWALDQTRRGLRVRRKAWFSTGFIFRDLEIYYATLSGNNQTDYRFTEADVLTEDWILFED